MKKFIYQIIILGLIALACDPDDPEFKVVDASSIDSLNVSLTGSISAYATGVPSNTYKYTMTSVGNSTYKWEVQGHGGIVTVTDENYGGVAEIGFNQSDVNTSATVVCTVTTDYGLSEVRSIDVDLSAYCAADVDALNETVFGSTESDLTYGADFTSIASFTYDASASTITAEDLSVDWMELAWAETITSQNSVIIDVDELGLNMTIQEQQYLTTLYNGDPYTYNILGEGVIDGCSNTFTLNWSLYNVEDDYSILFQIVGTMP